MRAEGKDKNKESLGLLELREKKGKDGYLTNSRLARLIISNLHMLIITSTKSREFKLHHYRMQHAKYYNRPKRGKKNYQIVMKEKPSKRTSCYSDNSYLARFAKSTDHTSVLSG